MKNNLPDFDEAKLTAYALNELDAAERGAVEKAIAENAAARQWVEEVRQTASLLEGELKAEECPALTSAQTRAIQQKVRTADQPSFWTRQWFPSFRLVEALAVVAIVAVLAAMLLPALSKAKNKSNRSIAMAEQRQKDLAKEYEKTESAPPAVPEVPSDKGMAVVPMELNPPATMPAPAPVAPPSASAKLKQDGSFGYATAAKSVTVVNNYNVQQGASALTGGGGYQQNNGPAVGTANAYAGAGGFRFMSGAATRSPAVNGAAYGIAPSGQLGVAGEDSKLELGDTPAQDRFYRAPANQPNDTATYPRLVENTFLAALSHPLSTFSIDVDTASYANVRRFLNSGQLPPPAAVRIEEMVNYFHYNYPQPRGNDPFAANIEIAGCPWNAEHRLVRIGLKGREIAQDKRPPSNFVFLIDVSGSMQPAERLPLIKQALRQLVKKMTANDRVAIVVYASAAGVKLESTSCAQKERILEAIDELGAGGSTAGAAGIQAAYEVAQENFIKGGVNRVLLCTDGDFNVGMTDQSQLVKLIQDKAKSGVFLTTLGVGTDNYKDALMQKLADKGNGNYAYLDTLEEAQKVLIDQMSGTLVTIAKDVKIQVEFNPAQVGAYRLIGYEKRMLRKEDFNNDKKDAGEIGAGHTVTALYEIVPAGEEISGGAVDDLKYQRPAEEKPERYVADDSKELLTLKLRYKQPDGNTSRLLEFPVTDSGKSFERASNDFKFATAVAEFGMLLRDSEFKGNSSYGTVLEQAEAAKGADAEGYRSEFLTLVKAAQRLAGQ